MSWPSSNNHEPKLCCVIQSIGKFCDKNICKQCLKDIIKRTNFKEEAFNEILEILNAFTLHDKN